MSPNLNSGGAPFQNMSPARFTTSPSLSDRYGWAHLCETGEINKVAGSDILEAYDYWRGDTALSDKLLHCISSIATKMLSRQIAEWLPDAEELRDKAALVIIKAAMRPTSPRGASFRKNFSHFVEWRGLDQLETVDYGQAAYDGPRPGGRVPFDETNVAALIARETDGREDLLDTKNALSRMDKLQLTAAQMHFLDGDSLDEIADTLNVTRYRVTAWLQPLLDIKDARR